jgi:predicted nucleic acid-binding protein
LIDTSSWIHALRQSGDPQVRDRLSKVVTAGEAVWCNAVRLELWNGARGPVEKRRLKDFDDVLPRLEIDNEVWELSCSLAKASRSAGLTVPAIDLLIFACARRHKVELDHCDEHFDRLETLARSANGGI